MKLTVISILLAVINFINKEKMVMKQCKDTCIYIFIFHLVVPGKMCVVHQKFAQVVSLSVLTWDED